MGCMPYGLDADQLYGFGINVSIPHMGCMPYGLQAPLPMQPLMIVSIPHMGCMPYGQSMFYSTADQAVLFQSLIWVACPTGL